MNFQINSIAGRGDWSTERLVIKALAAGDIGNHVLFRTQLNNGEPTTGVTDTFWFPNRKVAAGDLVILYSKSGTESDRKLDAGNVAHFLYWGRDRALWGEAKFGAVLLFAPEWESFIPN